MAEEKQPLAVMGSTDSILFACYTLHGVKYPFVLFENVLPDLYDTIIAPASAPGGSLRGILRISGKNALAAVKKIVAPSQTIALTQRSLCAQVAIDLPGNFAPLPAKLLIWQEGHSYTGDETVEIHTIGSPILLDAITSALISDSDSIRLAQPGEFTLRAFLSGRLDLTQAEAVLGIIDASNEDDLKTALHQLAGNVSLPLTALRTLLFETLTQLEAALDFSEEEIPNLTYDQLYQILDKALDEIEQLQQQIACRKVGGEKPKIVLAGLPNVGKSTLFNKLLQKEAALVSPMAGTTRDYLEAEIDWEGVPAALIDTAGIGRNAVSQLDATAQCKANDLLHQADVIIYCYETIDMLDPSVCLGDKKELTTKMVSFQTKTVNENLEPLLKEVGKMLHCSSKLGLLPNTALRCQESLLMATESLSRTKELTDVSLMALEIRLAVNHLGLIDGTVHTEDILDSIFSRFCIGK